MSSMAAATHHTGLHSTPWPPWQLPSASVATTLPLHGAGQLWPPLSAAALHFCDCHSYLSGITLTIHPHTPDRLEVEVGALHSFIFTVLHCTVLYCTVLHCTVLYCTALYCTVLHCTVQCCTALYCTVLHPSASLPSIPRLTAMLRPNGRIPAGRELGSGTLVTGN